MVSVRANFVLNVRCIVTKTYLEYFLCTGYSFSSRELPRTKAFGAKQDIHKAWCVSGEGTMRVGAHNRKCYCGDGGQERSVLLRWVCAYISYALLPPAEMAHMSSLPRHGQSPYFSASSRRRTATILLSSTLVSSFYYHFPSVDEIWKSMVQSTHVLQRLGVRFWNFGFFRVLSNCRNVHVLFANSRSRLCENVVPIAASTWAIPCF